jgi:hypothetical protein
MTLCRYVLGHQLDNLGLVCLPEAFNADPLRFGGRSPTVGGAPELRALHQSEGVFGGVTRSAAADASDRPSQQRLYSCRFLFIRFR